LEETIYKNYRILYQLTYRWFANIVRPGSRQVMGGNPITATKEEGERILLDRAYARIDEEEEKSTQKK
jgi:hypothetical protein